MSVCANTIHAIMILQRILRNGEVKGRWVTLELRLSKLDLETDKVNRDN